MGSLPTVNISALLSAMGGTSGFDVQSTVAQVIAAESVPATQWQLQIQTLQSQATLLNKFSSQVSGLTDDLNALQDPVGALTTAQVSSSNTSIVSGSAAAGTAAGTHIVVVNNLATTASWYSDSVASSSTPLASGAFTLQVGTGTAKQITIGSGVNTLDQLASYINGQNLGVNASVVTDDTGSRLAIVSSASGSGGDISITGQSGLGFTQANQGVNASVTVDGIPFSSASNVITGAVNGLTLNLLGAAPSTEISITVSDDTNAASQAINKFVNDYNTLIQNVNAQFKYNQSSATSGPLAGDSTLRMLQGVLLAAGGYSASEGSIATLRSIGVSMNNDGTMTVDNSALNSALQSNLSAVKTFFQGTGSDGFAQTLKSQLQTYTDPIQGAFTVDLKSNDNQQTNLEDQISNFQTYLAGEQTRLTAEFNRANILLQQLPMQIKQIQAELGNSQWGNSK